MAAFEAERDALTELGVSVYAATVDSEEKVKEVADSGIHFPLGYGVTREEGDRFGAWWDERRDFIQPSEFLIERDGKVLHSTYSASPIGRTDPGDLSSMLKFVIARREKAKG